MTLRRFAPLLPSLIGVVAVIAGLVYATSTSGRPAANPYAAGIPLPTPHSIVRNGHTYVVGQSPVVAASAHADPRVVTFYVYGSGPSSSPLCDALSPRLEVVAESGSSIAVAGFSYRVPTHGTRVFICSYGSIGCRSRPYTAITVRLAAPLAARAIVDAHTGAHVGVLGGQRLPRLGYVPAGFRENGGDDDFPLPGGDDTRLRPPCVMDLQAAYSNPAGRSFDIRLSSASNALGGRHATGAVVVDGHPGHVMTSPWETCVDWEQPVGLLREVCTSAKQPLATEELIKVARGLR